jgi:hypothetical protein
MNKKKMNECMNEKLFDPMHTQTIPSKLPPFDLALYSSKLLGAGAPGPRPSNFVFYPSKLPALEFSKLFIQTVSLPLPFRSSLFIQTASLPFRFRSSSVHPNWSSDSPISIHPKKCSRLCFLFIQAAAPRPPPLLSLSLARSLVGQRQTQLQRMRSRISVVGIHRRLETPPPPPPTRNTRKKKEKKVEREREISLCFTL